MASDGHRVSSRTPSEALPSTVVSEPSAFTDLTMPTCSVPKRISSPGAGVWVSRPVERAQSVISETEPRPWPWSPIGAPAWDAHQETK